MRKFLLLPLIMMFFSFLIVSNAFGVALDMSYIGTKGATMGKSFTGIADDSSAIYFNPAGLVFNKYTLDVQAAGLFVFTDYRYTDTSQMTGEKVENKSNENAILPNFFLSYKLNPKMALGLGLYVPYGGGTVKYENLSNNGLDVESQFGNVALTLSFAYKLSECFSIGVGVTGYYADIFQKTPQVGYNSMAGTMTITKLDSDFTGLAGFGGNLGILYKLNKQMSIGFTIKSMSSCKVDGKSKMSVSTMTGTTIMPEDEYDAELEYTLPMYYNLGFGYKMSEKMTLGLELAFMQWSQMDALKGKIKGIPTPTGGTMDQEIDQTLDYQDTFYVGAGVNYFVMNNLQLRGGITFAQTATKEHMLSLTNDVNQMSFSLGASYGITKQLEFLLSGGYVMGFERTNEKADTVHDKDFFLLITGLRFFM